MQQNSKKTGNSAFADQLRRLAREQRALSEQSIMPAWMEPVNAMIAENAFPFVVYFSLAVSMVVFLLFFRFFLQLGGIV